MSPVKSRRTTQPAKKRSKPKAEKSRKGPAGAPSRPMRKAASQESAPDDDPFGDAAASCTSPRPISTFPYTIAADLEDDDPFGDILATRRTNHSSRCSAVEEDPFGDETQATRTAPLKRSNAPVVRFADQEPPSKRQKLGQSLDATPGNYIFAAPAASPQPPNALAKVIQAAPTISLLPQPHDVCDTNIPPTPPSRGVETSKKMVRIFP